MIRKLRLKFVGIIMGVVGIFLVLILSTLYYSTRQNYLEQSLEALNLAIHQDSSGGPDNSPGSPPPESRRDETPVLTASVDSQGKIQVIKNRLLNIDESEVQDLIAAVSPSVSDGRSGSLVLPERHLRCLWEKNPGSQQIRYAFADIYPEEQALKSQLLHSLAIGLGALAAFWLVAIRLSHWVAAPVVESWERQQQFVADASHELKTPLTVILSNVSLILQNASGLDEKTRQRAGHIQAEALRMEQLTQGLLTLARSDISQQNIPHVPLSLSFLVNQSVMAMEALVFECGKTLESTVDDEIWVNGNEKELSQLLHILLDNACKYSDPGTAIRVSLKKYSEKEALLSVVNQGKPLSKEEQKKIFDRFYRTDPSRSDIPGYGLGLPIAQSVALAHKGRMEVSSDRSGQICFQAALPLIKRPAL